MSEPPDIDVDAPADQESRLRVTELTRRFEDRSPVLVLSHDNPDPDSLASAFVVRHLLEKLNGADVTVGYGGIIGRSENRAMVRELELDPVPVGHFDWTDFDAVVLVDTQPGAGNNSLPADLAPAAVIDHHPLKCDPSGIPFVDVREGFGATSTMVAEYARAADVELPRPLATAIFYAIRSETQDLGREADLADLRTYMRLFFGTDVRALARIQRARVPREYFRAFQTAIERARVYGRTVFTDLRRLDVPDMVAEIADFLLRLEGADWSCCIGRYGEEMMVSLRTSEPDGHAGRAIRTVVAERGSAGGHGMSAGGQIPLGDDDYRELATDLRKRLLEYLGSSRPGEPLVLTG